MIKTLYSGFLSCSRMGITLHGICIKIPHGHSHGGPRASHSHSHEYNRKETPENINMRAAIIHVIGDLIQSIGIFIASIIIKQYVSIRLYIVVMILTSLER